ncbi:MAG: LLM class flavin-dependent oxidoreductase [Acidobacteria bacterium]|nr:LLM class flavin-dependent oxidoreductase [Acidobacteriota bacterium]
MTLSSRLHLISSTPQCDTSKDQISTVRRAAHWAESAGHDALLVGTDTGPADPWALANLVLDETEQLVPVVAVQPAMEHPYAVARRISTLHRLHGRAPHIELGARAGARDLVSVGDRAPAEARHVRLLEFGQAVRALLSNAGPISLHGEFYELRNPPPLPALAPEAQPQFFAAATSRGAERISRQIDATLVHDVTCADGRPSCIRVGIIARDTDADAWDVAASRFPEERSGMTFDRRLEAAWTDDPTQTSLLAAAAEETHRDRDLWLAPFERRQAPCAYFVGSHADVARRVRPWLEAGTCTFMLDAAACEEDLLHTGVVFERAWRRLQSPLAVSG